VPAGPADSVPEPAARWTQLLFLSIGLSFAMAPSFAASAVAPQLRSDWGLGAMGLPVLTVAVLVGFSISAIVLAATGAPDVVPGPRLFAIGAAGAGLANLGFASSPRIWPARSRSGC